MFNNKEAIAFETPDILNLVINLLNVGYDNYELGSFIEDILYLSKKNLFDIDNNVTDIDIAEVVNKYKHLVKDVNSLGYISLCLKSIINEFSTILILTGALDKIIYVTYISEYKIIIEALLSDIRNKE